MQKSCGARLGGMSDAWSGWWSAFWPSASELSAWFTLKGDAVRTPTFYQSKRCAMHEWLVW
jgi:hypothetical protein